MAMFTKLDNVPQCGVYIVWLYLPQVSTITVGKLGVQVFQPGIYAYCGSAQRHLQSRLRRHARRAKTLHWHIDYFREYCMYLGASVVEDDRQGECRLTRALLLLPGSRFPMPGFGASDCRCYAHLVFLPAALPSRDALTGGVSPQVIPKPVDEL